MHLSTTHATRCYAVLFLFIVPVLIEAAEVSSELLTLQKAAGQAVQEKKFDIASRTYESIIRRNPAADAAMDARGKLVSVYLQTGQRAQADAVAEALMIQASNSAAFKQALHEAARAYRWKAKDPACARQLYSRWMDKYGADLEVQTAVVKTWLEEKNIEQANAALETFKQVCKDQEPVFHETNHLAGEFKKLAHPEKSAELCRWFLSTYPNHEKTVSAKVTLNASLIDLHLQRDERSQADAALNELMIQESDDTAFKDALCEAAEMYRGKGKDAARAREIYTDCLKKFGTDPQAFKMRCGIVKTYLDESDLEQAKKAVNVLLSEQPAQPEITKTIRDVGDAYSRKGNHTEAVQLYKASISHCPKAKDVIYAFRSLACSSIELGDPDGAMAVAEVLLTNYAGNPEAARLIQNVAFTYFREEHYPEAARLYKASVQKWPNAVERIHSQSGLVCSLIHMHQLDSAKAATKTLLSTYMSHPEIARAVRDVADAYRYKKFFADSVPFYRMVLQNWPASAESLYAHRGLGCSLAQLEDLAGAAQAADTILSGYAAHPKAGTFVFYIGEEYFKKAEKLHLQQDSEHAHAEFRNAIAIWEKIISRTEAVNDQSDACYYLGITYQYIEDYEKAIAYYRQTVEQWPTYERSWNAQFQIAVCYDQLFEQGLISAEEVNTQILIECQLLEQKFPNSKASGAAKELLKKHDGVISQS